MCIKTLSHFWLLIHRMNLARQKSGSISLTETCTSEAHTCFFGGYLTVIVSFGIFFDEPDLGFISNNKGTLVVTLSLLKIKSGGVNFHQTLTVRDELEISQQVPEEKRHCPLKLLHKFRFLGGKAEFSLPNLQSPSFFFRGRKHWWSIVASTGW